MKNLVIGITAPGSVLLLEGQANYFSKQGYQVYLLAPEEKRTLDFCSREGCTLLPVPIERDISLLKDISSLRIIIKHLKRIKPDIINTGTPKMGLLAILAARFCSIPLRIYTCRGFRFEFESGFKRKILIGMEKLSALFAHNVICISQSLKNKGVELNIFNEKKAIVINKGSSNGINLSKYNPEIIDPEQKKELLKTHNCEGSFIFGFIGRIYDRKGILELYDAFNSLCQTRDNIRLLVVGPFEKVQIQDLSIITKLEEHPQIILTGFQSDVPLYLSLMDVFVLPTWGEGFGNVLIQAAAMGIPVISTNTTGSKDAVSNSYNGVLISPRSRGELESAMESIYSDSTLRDSFGKNGIEWAKNFDNQIIWEGMSEIYNN